MNDGQPWLARLGSAWRRRRSLVLLQLTTLAVFLVVWQFAADHGLVRRLFTSAPTEIAVAFWHGVAGGPYWLLTAETLVETLIGFAVGSVIAFIVGFGFFEFPLLRDVLRPFLTGLNSLPRIALAPLFVLWFGLGSTSRIVLGVTLVFFIVLNGTYTGLDSCDRDYLVLARSIGANRLERLWRFVIPSALPSIFAALQLGLTYTFLGVVAAEMLVGIAGLGGRLAVSIATFDTADFFAALLMLVLVSIVISGAMYALENRLLHWRAVELRGVR